MFAQIAETTKLVVFYFLECFSPLIGFINIYTLSTNRNKYNIHCCRMSNFNMNGEMFPLLLGLKIKDALVTEKISTQSAFFSFLFLFTSAVDL